MMIDQHEGGSKSHLALFGFDFLAPVDGARVLRVWAMQSGRPVLRCPDGETPPVSPGELVIQGVAVQVVRSRGR